MAIETEPPAPERQAWLLRISALEAALAKSSRELADFDAILDLVPVGICIADDPECRNIRFNREFSRLLGLPRSTNISLTPPTGQLPPCVAMIGNRVIPGDELPMQVAARERREVSDSEHDLVFADGRRYSLVVNARPLFDEHNEVRGVIAVCWDVTSRNAQARRLRDLADSRDAMLREVNHRVKNKLQLLLSLFELKLSNTPGGEAAEVLREMRDRVWAVSLLHDTLHQGEDRQFVEISGYLTRLVEQIAAAHGAPGRRIALITTIPALLFPFDCALRLGMIVNELVMNSLKHAFPEDRGGTIRVVGKVCEHLLTLTVEDDGVGLRPAQASSGAEGLGRRVVRSLAGSLKSTVEEFRECGTRVRLTIPVARDPRSFGDA